MALIPQFGGLIWTLLAFVIALSVIVAIHEYGHYIVGRWSGIHADVFSLGFGPVIYSRYDKRGTKWQIAALPFGGYVKFAGDADAASGKDVAAMEAAEADPKRLRPPCMVRRYGRVRPQSLRGRCSTLPCPFWSSRPSACRSVFRVIR